jgi:hypothetical protein
MNSPQEAALGHALRQGFLSEAQLGEARALCSRLQAEGKSVNLLSLLAERWLTPEQTQALAAIYRQSGGGSGRLPRSGSDLAPVVPADGATQTNADPGGGGPAHGPIALGGLTHLGPYEVGEELARGGMGAVFRGRHADLGREVALKIVLNAQGNALARFLREAKATARLRHPNIVALHSFGSEGGLPYLAMDLVEGRSLKEQIEEEGALDEAKAARIAEALASALSCAHAQGILHRDVKPANVLLDGKDGQPLLTDFGLAKLESEQESITRTGTSLGTPVYMPPEQAKGDKARMDERSDVYSVGATLYELLTGSPPFSGTSAVNVMVAVVHKDPAPPSSLRPGLDPALEAICLRCMRKLRDERYPSAQALGDALAAWRLEHATEDAIPQALASVSPRAPLALLVVGALVGGAVAWALPAPASSESPAAVAQPSGVTPGASKGPTELARVGWHASAEEARWSRLREDLAQASSLVGIVRARIQAADAGGLSRLWEEVHRRLGDPGAPLLAATQNERRWALLRSLADRGAPLAGRVRAALALGRIPFAGVAQALREVEEDSSPLLRAAARSSVLALEGASAGKATAEERLAAWALTARSARGPSAAAHAITLCEQSLATRGSGDDLAELVKAKDPLLRAALPLALAFAATRAGSALEPEAIRAWIAPLEADSDPLVQESARSCGDALLLFNTKQRFAPSPERLLPALRAAGQFVGVSPCARGFESAYSAALAEATQATPQPGIQSLAAWHALRSGDLAGAGQLAAKVSDSLSQWELRAQVALLLGSSEPVRPEGLDPVAVDEARRRLSFVRRYGVPALPAANGGMRVDVHLGSAAPPLGLKRALRSRVLGPKGGEGGLRASHMVLRSRFGFDCFYGSEVRGDCSTDGTYFALGCGPFDGDKSGMVWWLPGKRREVRFYLDAQRHLSAGLEYTVNQGAALSLRRTSVDTWADEVRLPSFRSPLRRRELAPRCLLRVPGGEVRRWTISGRWNGEVREQIEPGPEAFEAAREKLVPLGDAFPVFASNVKRPPATWGDLRARAWALLARGRWTGKVRRPDLLGAGALRGDLEFRGRVHFPGKTDGREAGIALRFADDLRGDFLRLELRSTTTVGVMYQRGDGWDYHLARGKRPGATTERVCFSIQRLGDFVQARFGPDFEHLESIAPGLPFHFPFQGRVDAVLYAMNYTEREPFHKAEFDQIELRVLRPD